MNDQTIILYDGTCGLCHHLVQFTLHRDRRGVIRFSALQSDFSRSILTRHNLDPDTLDTLYVVTAHERPQERLRCRARAALFVLRTVGGPWRLLTVFGILPTILLDFGYTLISRSRHRFFGKRNRCFLPKASEAERFID